MMGDAVGAEDDVDPTFLQGCRSGERKGPQREGGRGEVVVDGREVGGTEGSDEEGAQEIVTDGEWEQREREREKKSRGEGERKGRQGKAAAIMALGTGLGDSFTSFCPP